MAKVESQYQKAKTTCARRGSTVEDLKFVLRKQFRSRLLDMRSKSVDTCRNLTDDVNEGYRELVHTLESQCHNFEFLEPDDVFKTLKEIQAELLEQIANQELIDYECYDQHEVDSIVENLITCKICEQYSEKDICDNCSVKHFADYRL